MMNIVITGANRGIGLELCHQYSANHHVFALCRKASAKLKTIPNLKIIEGVDVKNSDAINKAVSECPDHLDLLINNAGILSRVGLDTFNESIVFDQFNVNAMGPLRVTHSFLSRLKKGSKVAFITSRMGSIEDNTSGSHYGYRMSKAALNMAGKSLAIDLKDHGVSVGIIHPGWVQTDMTGQTGHYSVQQAASQIITRIQELTISTTGHFWHSDGSTLPW